MAAKSRFSVNSRSTGYSTGPVTGRIHCHRHCMDEEKPTVRVSKVTIPEHCDPRAKLVFAEMKRQAVTYDELEWKSGVLRSTFKAWRKNNRPGLETVEAALGALGWTLLPVPRLANLPTDLRSDLEAIAAKHGLKALPHPELVSACIGHCRTGAFTDARERRAA